MKKILRILAASMAPAPVLAGVILAGSAHATAAEPLVAVPHSVNPTLAHANRVGAVDAGKPMSVAIALNLHNQAQLRQFLADVGNPRSPLYRHYLTPAQFNAEYGPTAADVATVTSFARAQGLTVRRVSANRQVVDVTGTAGQVEKAFHTNISTYRQSQHEFYANDGAAQLPSTVAGMVAGIAGLDNHSMRHTDNVRNPHATPRAGSGLTPGTIASGYGISGLGNGSGQTVALWEFDGYQAQNISQYDSNFGLNSSAPTTVSVDGANYDSSPGQGQGEVELDIELVQAVAPAASTLVYEAPNSDQGQIDMAAKIVSDDKVSVTSISWGECEAASSGSTITSTDNELKQGAAEGISFYAASGDSGSDDCGNGSAAVDYPASDPNVSGTGGTTLSLGSNGGWANETAWNGSGGGTSNAFSGRTVPDVAADADPSTGYAIFSAGQWQEFGGTSCAAPVWSGLTALLDAKSGGNHGNLDSKFDGIGGGSGYGSAFHDITSGGNGAFNAGTGKDDVTGWGSPIASGLAGAVG